MKKVFKPSDEALEGYNKALLAKGVIKRLVEKSDKAGFGVVFDRLAMWTLTEREQYLFYRRAVCLLANKLSDKEVGVLFDLLDAQRYQDIISTAVFMQPGVHLEDLLDRYGVLERVEKALVTLTVEVLTFLNTYHTSSQIHLFNKVKAILAVHGIKDLRPPSDTL